MNFGARSPLNAIRACSSCPGGFIPHEGAAEKAKHPCRRLGSIATPAVCSQTGTGPAVEMQRAQALPRSGKPAPIVRRRRDAQGHARRKSRAGALRSAVLAAGDGADPRQHPDGKRKRFGPEGPPTGGGAQERKSPALGRAFLVAGWAGLTR